MTMGCSLQTHKEKTKEEPGTCSQFGLEGGIPYVRGAS